MTSGRQAVADEPDAPSGRDGASCDVRSPFASAWFWAGCTVFVGAWSAAAALLLVLL